MTDTTAAVNVGYKPETSHIVAQRVPTSIRCDDCGGLLQQGQGLFLCRAMDHPTNGDCFTIEHDDPAICQQVKDLGNGPVG